MKFFKWVSGKFNENSPWNNDFKYRTKYIEKIEFGYLSDMT